MVMGPARVISSVNTPVSGAALVMCTYTKPARFCGMAHAPLAKGMNAVPPICPVLVKAQKVPPVAVV